MNFVVLADHMVKFQECENEDKCLDVSYQLSPVNFPSESSPLSSPGYWTHTFGYVSGSTTVPCVPEDRYAYLHLKMILKTDIFIVRELDGVKYFSDEFSIKIGLFSFGNFPE